MLRRHLVGCAFVLLLIAVPALAATRTGAAATATNARRTGEVLQRVRHNHALLLAFLRQMPKGADLHNHLSGAIYAETWLHWATAAHLCVDARAQLSQSPCNASSKTVDETDEAQRQRLIDAWSMRDFVASSGTSGHDHFFATFGLFGPAGNGHTGDEIARVVARAAREHELYLELMVTLNGAGTYALGQKAGFSNDLDTMRQHIEAAGLAQVVAVADQELQTALRRERADLHCGTPQAEPGCRVEVRFLYQVLRGLPPQVVFTQLLTAYALVRSDPDEVGLNLVMPEDGYVAMHDFELHMRMLDYLHRRHPEVPITLHAGELSPTMVPPAGLRRHIRDSIEIGHARRIGHGVDVMYEDHPLQLLQEMADKHVLVEICLTSNAVILGIEGRNHPLPIYLRQHVPVALATDDEGVSRSDLTREFLRAEETYGLSYRTLKTMVRASLEHSFASGASLWRRMDDYQPVAACGHDVLGSVRPSAGCAALLKRSDKARLEWAEEAAFRQFEKTVAHDPIWP